MFRLDPCNARILQHQIGHLNGKLYIDISDERTEIQNTIENRNKWLNATVEEVDEYFNQVCCPGNVSALGL